MKHVRSFALLLTVSCSAALATPTYFAGTGHWYEAFLAPTPAGIDWYSAKAAAEGLGGHLATISSGAENTFVHSLVVGNAAFWLPNDGAGNTEGPWLGGIQWTDTPSAPWSWVTGETFGYNNWSGGEPNNWAGSEDALVFFGHGVDQRLAEWNDVNHGFGARGYIVEFESNASGVAESASVPLLLGLGLAGLIGFRRRGVRA